MGLSRSVRDRAPVVLRRGWVFWRAHGRVPRLRHPVTLSEKINHRILYDRRPELSPTCDKLAMKDLALASGADVRIPETWWTGTDLVELRHVELPGAWVLKPNHSTNGRVVFGDGSVVDLAALAERTRGWLEPDRHARLHGEWAYTQARRTLLVEQRIGPTHRALADYKVLVFHGVPALVQVHEGRFGAHTKRLYRPDWTPLPAQPGYPPAPPTPPPACLPRLLEAAASIARAYDFMRVDLYDWAGELWFGELTPYPASGLKTFAPRELDAELGALWTLPKLSGRCRTGAVARWSPQGSNPQER